VRQRLQAQGLQAGVQALDFSLWQLP
jgi:hypothetical protein